MSRVLLSKSEVNALLRARAIMMAIEKRASDKEFLTERVTDLDIGMVLGSASCAEWAIFTVMNCANVYCDVPVDEFRPNVTDYRKRQ